MAVGAVARPTQQLRPRPAAVAPRAAAVERQGAAPDPAAPPPPKPDADGVTRSDAAKLGYKAWLKGQCKRFFDDIIMTATKRRS